jgi:hypothetical protein
MPAVTEDGQKVPGVEVRPTAGDGSAAGAHHVSSSHRWFRNRDLRQQVADLLGVTPAEYTPLRLAPSPAVGFDLPFT